MHCSTRYVFPCILPAENYAAPNSRSSVFCIVSAGRICDPVLGHGPRFCPRYRMLRTFSTSRNVPPSDSDPVLGHEPIFRPRYHRLHTFSTGRNLPAPPMWRPLTIFRLHIFRFYSLTVNLKRLHMRLETIRTSLLPLARIPSTVLLWSSNPTLVLPRR